MHRHCLLRWWLWRSCTVIILYSCVVGQLDYARLWNIRLSPESTVQTITSKLSRSFSSHLWFKLPGDYRSIIFFVCLSFNHTVVFTLEILLEVVNKVCVSFGRMLISLVSDRQWKQEDLYWNTKYKEEDHHNPETLKRKTAKMAWLCEKIYSNDEGIHTIVINNEFCHSQRSYEKYKNPFCSFGIL